MFFGFQSPAPAPFVKEMNDAGQFYTNRVLKEWKEKYVQKWLWRFSKLLNILVFVDLVLNNNLNCEI